MCATILTIVMDLIELLRILENKESEICEFKVNNADPEKIGRNIAALANSATLMDASKAYLFFGINNGGEVVGTEFDVGEKYKNQKIENWLRTQFSPDVGLDIDKVKHSGKNVVVFSISSAKLYPVRFKGQAYIRVGSYTKPLFKHLDLERNLWKRLTHQAFEREPALGNLDQESVLIKLHFDKYFELRKINLDSSPDQIIDRLILDGFVKQAKGLYSITNLGALLMAKDINEFGQLSRKMPRLVIYKGNSRTGNKRDIIYSDGYIACLPKLFEYVASVLPVNEEIKDAFRTEQAVYPDRSVRELIINSLIHQDLNQTGVQPLVEIFSNRIEFSNPGRPLIDVDRFVDGSMSRNEVLAKTMRLLGLCEEMGSGIDLVVSECEVHQLPPPSILVDDLKTKIVLRPPKRFRDMNRLDRLRACYLHACLKFVDGESMTNRSLRKRFNIDNKNYSIVSRVIRDALDNNLIRADSDSQSSSKRSYIPYWAKKKKYN